MSVWSALLLFRLILNSLFRFVLNCIDAREKTECCIFISFVTNITKIVNVLQNYIFLVRLNCGLTFVLSNFKNT